MRQLRSVVRIDAKLRMTTMVILPEPEETSDLALPPYREEIHR